MRNISLFVNPGNGYRTVVVDDSMTLADLVSKENLFDRTISLDGEEVVANEWSTTSLRGVNQIWATGAVKGA